MSVDQVRDSQSCVYRLFRRSRRAGARRKMRPGMRSSSAAKKEGKVVVYNMALGAPYFKDVLKSFEAKYGIPVESLDLRASELAERIRTEQAAGRFLGDAEMISSTMIEEQLQNGDFIQKLPAIPNAAQLRPPFKASEYSVPAFMQPMGILINTRMVKDKDVPKSWNDLNDPKWKGKILSDDMRPLGSGNTMFVDPAEQDGRRTSMRSWPNKSRSSAATCATTPAGSRAANIRSMSRRSSPSPRTSRVFPSRSSFPKRARLPPKWISPS